MNEMAKEWKKKIKNYKFYVFFIATVCSSVFFIINSEKSKSFMFHYIHIYLFLIIFCYDFF